MINLYPVRCPFCYEVIESVLGKSSCANCEKNFTAVEIKDGEKVFRYTTLEALQDSWKADPIWDIEDTEGFEAYRDELLAWRKSYELECDLQHKRRERERSAFVCVKTGIKDLDIASALHTFKEIENAVASQDRVVFQFEKLEDQATANLAQEQIRATLLLAAQVMRVADELKEIRQRSLDVRQA